jgi:hypothetical protein
MHSPAIKGAALELVAQGVNDCEISRRLGVPRGTIRDWRRPTYVPRNPEIPRGASPRCWRTANPVRFTSEDYSELLGLYLGDGRISKGPRTQRLRLHLDTKYSKMNREIGALLERCFLENTVGKVAPGPSGWSERSDSLLVLSVYSNHLSCLFPQHGPGRKHERRIELERWRTELVARAPWGFDPRAYPFRRLCLHQPHGRAPSQAVRVPELRLLQQVHGHH